MELQNQERFMNENSLIQTTALNHQWGWGLHESFSWNLKHKYIPKPL